MPRLRFAVLAVCLLMLSAAAVPASAHGTRGPDNDSFISAQSIALNAKYKAVDVHEATTEFNEPVPTCHGTDYKSVWYKFTAPFHGWITVSATGSYVATPVGNVPAVTLTVFTGSAPGALTEVACAQAGLPPEIPVMDVWLGETYYIRVSSPDPDTLAGSYYKVKTAVQYAQYYPALADPGFESNSPTWVVKNALNGDGRVCGTGEAHDGNCAFKFIGGPDEATKLQQTFAWPVEQVAGKRDHAFIVIGHANATSGTNVALKITLVISYTGGKPKTKDSYTYTGPADAVYHAFGLTASLTNPKVERIKLALKNKSASDSVLVDSFVTHYFGGALREAAGTLAVPAPAQ